MYNYIPFKYLSEASQKEATERMWKYHNKYLLRKERLDRIRRGIIRPEARMQPQMMVKDDRGRWCPEIKIWIRLGYCIGLTS